MRTRSSRFFVILLHLVGVSHHLPVQWRNNGIVGVHPWPIVLETVPIQDLIDSPQEPVWLQDRADKQCLGPTGSFMECGDATLWFVVRRTLADTSTTAAAASTNTASASKRQSPIRMGLFGIEAVDGTDRLKPPPPPQAWSFHVVDGEYPTAIKGTQEEQGATDSDRPWWNLRSRRRKQIEPPVECLLGNAALDNIQVQTCLPDTKRHRRRKRNRSVASQLQEDQHQQQHDQLMNNAWAWNVNEQGVFVSMAKNSNALPTKQCLWRSNGTLAVLDDCAAVATETPSTDTTEQQQRQVQFSVVRYRAVTVSAATATSHLPAHHDPTAQVQSADTPTSVSEQPKKAKAVPQDHLPSNKARANRAASEHNLPFALLKDTNPILLMGHTNIGGKQRERRTGIGGGGSSSSSSSSRTSSLVHPRDAADEAAGHMAPRRMQVHPYIAAAKNEMWTDPATGLWYNTDLCDYLGRDTTCKEQGRHTLMGVGQYRKGYVIKVYGIAFYVSKRDVLAHKVFEPYAGLTAEELRNRPDFYETLRQPPAPSHPLGHGMFDRTILIKTNMQLATETMRSSLQADWKLLSEEAKTTMISSSLEPRPADAGMLKIISSPENPSRCSCSQVAPPEYEADPSCCARGTELGFTWLRTGGLEIRLNGRLMETFARPDIAEGIFYEYLRTDDPISTELRERVVDGFPFLLAPLVRAKDFHASSSPAKAPEQGNPVFRVMSGVAESATSQAVALAGLMQNGAFEAAGHAMNAARSFGDAAHSLGSELDRRRGLLVKHAVLLPEAIINLVSRDKDPIQTVTDWVSGNATPEDPEGPTARKISQGRVFGYPMSRWFSDTYHAPDEIGPMKIRPTMTMRRKIFLTLVHLYLLLLLIVSFPGSYTTRTKLVVRKRHANKPLPVASTDECANRKRKNRCIVKVPDLARSSQERQKCQEGTFSQGSFLSRARRALRPTDSDDLEDEASTSSGSASGAPLKKKSLSYFL